MTKRILNIVPVPVPAPALDAFRTQLSEDVVHPGSRTTSSRRGRARASSTADTNNCWPTLSCWMPVPAQRSRGTTQSRSTR